MDRVPMTEGGHETLVKELKNLRSVERPNVVDAIEEARAHGDLSENAEYHAARDKQSFIEGRIAELEDKLSRAEVIDTSQIKGVIIRFGATVSVVDEDTDEESTYQIVGEDEADVGSGLLSVTSPLARALISKEVGDSIELTTPGGSKGYEILKLLYK